MIKIINVNFDDANLIRSIHKELVENEIIPNDWINSINCFELSLAVHNQSIKETKVITTNVVVNQDFETLIINNTDSYCIEIFLIGNIVKVEKTIQTLQSENADYKTNISIGVLTNDIQRINQIDTLIKSRTIDIKRLIINLLYTFTNYSTDLRNYDIEDIAGLIKKRNFTYNWKQFERVNINEQIERLKKQLAKYKTPTFLFIKGMELGNENFGDIIESFTNYNKPSDMIWKIIKGNEFEIDTLIKTI